MVHGFLRQSFMACCLTWSFGFETDVQVIFPDKLRQLSAIGDGIITNFDAIGFGYTPQSNIVDHARIDLDQADVIQALKFNSFSTARDVYQKGGHSFAVATVMLATPLPRKMPARSVVSGTTISGVNLRASLLKDAPILATALDIVYPFFSEDEETPKCRVGGAMVRDTDGCLNTQGIITIGGIVTLSYTYDLIADNYNLRTIQGFSTGSSDVFINCQRCPLSTHQKFVNYYGDFFYADDFIQAALDGSQTNFENGNIDFARVGSQGRSEAIKRFTVYLNIWMFVVGMLEFSIEACIENELLNSLSYWDQAVAFYVGSLEGTDGSGDGLLLYHLADQICVEFDSCDENGSSAVNRNVFEVFKNGQSDVAQGDCIAVEARKNRIVSLLSVPMIQGGILYTAKTDKGERDHIAGFVFASAILPLLYDCNREKAAIIYDAFKNSFEMGVDTTTVLPLVTAAFEDNYECLGITCKDVGDLYGAELCGGPLAGSKAGNSSGSDVDNPDIWNGEESSSFTVMSITIRWIYLTVPIVGWVLLFAA